MGTGGAVIRVGQLPSDQGRRRGGHAPRKAGSPSTGSAQGPALPEEELRPRTSPACPSGRWSGAGRDPFSCRTAGARWPRSEGPCAIPPIETTVAPVACGSTSTAEDPTAPTRPAAQLGPPHDAAGPHRDDGLGTVRRRKRRPSTGRWRARAAGAGIAPDVLIGSSVGALVAAFLYPPSVRVR